MGNNQKGTRIAKDKKVKTCRHELSMGFQYAFTDIKYIMQDEDMAERIFGLLALI